MPTKSGKKRSAKKASVKRGKTAAGRSSGKKPPQKKPAGAKKASSPRKSSTVEKRKQQDNIVREKSLIVEPGPPSRVIPPVEEPARHETAIGVVTHYYSHLSVAVIQINRGELRTGDTIRIKGHSSDLSQNIDSMEYEHRHIDRAEAGQTVGIKVKDHVREHDIVYVIR